MKRSEMVRIMWDFIQKVECDYDFYMSEASTDALLAEMEKAGMQPPLPAQTSLEAVNKNGDKLFVDGFLTKAIFNWEPEDEAK